MTTKPARRAAIYRYQIPLVPAIRCAGVDLNQRQGLLIQLQFRGDSGDYGKGYGEVAPLSGFSPETLDDAQQDLTALAQDWLAVRSSTRVDSASARFGFSCALHELSHGPLCPSAQPRPYRLWQGDLSTLQHHDQAQSDRPLQVNVTDQINSTDQLNSIKLKLARLPQEQEITRVQQLLQHAPQSRLRIDCNQGWDLAQAQQFVSAINANAIDYLEEPCATLKQTLALAELTGVRVALDETLRQPEFAAQPSRLPIHSGITALVIKPSLTGCLDQLHHWITLGQQRGLRTILSSSYESSLGLSQIAALAEQLTPNEPPGLDTADSFTANLLRTDTTNLNANKTTLSLDTLECLWRS